METGGAAAETHCDTLQHTATSCSTLMIFLMQLLVAVRTWVFEWRLMVPLQKHTATHCNALQHTATHCNTLIILLVQLLAAVRTWVCEWRQLYGAIHGAYCMRCALQRLPCVL